MMKLFQANMEADGTKSARPWSLFQQACPWGEMCHLHENEVNIYKYIEVQA